MILTEIVEVIKQHNKFFKFGLLAALGRNLAGLALRACIASGMRPLQKRYRHVGND